jgi:hypothetical protein
MTLKILMLMLLVGLIAAAPRFQRLIASRDRKSGERTTA